MFFSQGSKHRRTEFAHLVREHGSSLVVLTRRLVGTQDADDVLQSALLAAWRSFASRAELRNPHGWLCQFVAHEAQNLIRRRGRSQGAVDVTEVDPPSSVEEVFSALQVELASGLHAGSPQELLNHVEDGLRSALLTLTDQERATFLMRVIAELSYRELADVFAVPVGTVMSRLHRAREKLRAQLRSDEAGSLAPTPGRGKRGSETSRQPESTA